MTDIKLEDPGELAAWLRREAASPDYQHDTPYGPGVMMPARMMEAAALLIEHQVRERDELQTRLAAAGHAPECGSQICARCGRDYFALVHKPSHENYSPHDFVPGACTPTCYQHQEWDRGQ